MSKNIANTQLRIESDLFAKAKILAAVYDESFNALAVRLLQNAVTRYEQDHGPLPQPLQVDEQQTRS